MIVVDIELPRSVGYNKVTTLVKELSKESGLMTNEELKIYRIENG